MSAVSLPLPQPTAAVMETDAESPLDLSQALQKNSAAAGAVRTVSTEKKSRFLSKKAVAILQHWYQKHRDHPYATDEEVKVLAVEGGIAPNQVSRCLL